MAVRIVKKEPDPSVVKQIVCRDCGAMLEYTPIDTSRSHYKDISGTSSTVTWITCPNCNQPVTISDI